MTARPAVTARPGVLVRLPLSLGHGGRLDLEPRLDDAITQRLLVLLSPRFLHLAERPLEPESLVQGLGRQLSADRRIERQEVLRTYLCGGIAPLLEVAKIALRPDGRTGTNLLEVSGSTQASEPWGRSFRIDANGVVTPGRWLS